MAELLVKAVSATHTDPDKDTRGCYKQGDVIGVAPNGWEWGALELLPPADGGKFVIIKITDVTRAQVINWVRNHWATWIDRTDRADDPDAVAVRRRRVRIDIDLVPLAVRQQLNTTGQYTTTWTAIRKYVRNKLNNQTADGSPIE
jgi:hypothetical protein